MLPKLEEISKRRRVLGLSQKQLARLAGVSQSLIAKVEAGKTEPSYLRTKSIFDTLEKLQGRKNCEQRISSSLESSESQKTTPYRKLQPS